MPTEYASGGCYNHAEGFYNLRITGKAWIRGDCDNDVEGCYNPRRELRQRTRKVDVRTTREGFL